MKRESAAFRTGFVKIQSPGAVPSLFRALGLKVARPSLLMIHAKKLGVLASVALGSVLSTGCTEVRVAAAEESKDDAVSAELVTVERRPVSRLLQGSGLLKRKREYDLAFKVGGVAAAVAVEEGARVKKGQLLARIDSTELRAGADQARAALAKAERDRARVEALGARGSVAPQLVEDATTGTALARAAVEAAEFNNRQAVLVAPEDGLIDRRLVEPGEIVGPGQPAFHLSGVSQGAMVEIGLPDREALLVRPGMKAQVLLDACPDQVFSGSVSRVATQASLGTGTLDVEIAVEGLPKDLPSGLVAKITLETAPVLRSLVPLSSLVAGEGKQSAVMILVDGKARRLPIQLDFMQQENAVVLRGLEGQAQIIGRGAQLVKEGKRVRLVKESGR